MSSFCTFFSKNISIYAIFNDQSFNSKLTNDIISFEQLGPYVVFLWRNQKNTCISTFWLKKVPYLELCTESLDGWELNSYKVNLFKSLLYMVLKVMCYSLSCHFLHVIQIIHS